MEQNWKGMVYPHSLKKSILKELVSVAILFCINLFKSIVLFNKHPIFSLVTIGWPVFLFSTFKNPGPFYSYIIHNSSYHYTYFFILNFFYLISKRLLPVKNFIAVIVCMVQFVFLHRTYLWRRGYKALELQRNSVVDLAPSILIYSPIFFFIELSSGYSQFMCKNT